MKKHRSVYLAQVLCALLLLAVGAIALNAFTGNPLGVQTALAGSFPMGRVLLPRDQIKDQAIATVKQFHKEAQTWGKAHLYFDQFDGKNYQLDGSYLTRGIGEDLDKELNAAATTGDYQQVLTDAQIQLFQLHMLEQDFKDKTPFNKVHKTDLKLLDHYQLRKSQVLVISTVEQTLRVYDNGKLVRSFLVTTGTPDLPAVPGLWLSLWRVTKTTFHSPYPKSSPFYYPPTKINFAIMYHEGGYFVHDSWWRTNYGPGTQFVHPDASGNRSSTTGTHGCINIPESIMPWLYRHTSYSTMILIY